MVSNINKEIDEFIISFSHIKTNFPKYYEQLSKEYTELKSNLNKSLSLGRSVGRFSIKRELLKNNSLSFKRNYFTISSKDSFNELLLGGEVEGWSNSLIFHPLNDHSRQYLKKGDVLFCYRQGQFADLNTALNKRGIYAVGVAASDPVELFTEAENHNRWGILISFPIILSSHLELRNIQMHPFTIDLTPYNGNRNDSLQHIPEEKHYLTLMNMIYSKNYKIQKQFEEFFDDIKFKQTSLPNTIENYYLDENSSPNSNSRNTIFNFIQNEFINWFRKTENHKKSYDGLVTLKVLNFWNENYFNKLLFFVDIENSQKSIENIEKLILDKNNLEWKSYSDGTSKGAPEAVLGKNNYLKFLNEFFSDSISIENYKRALNKTTKNSFLKGASLNLDMFAQNCRNFGILLSNSLCSRFTSSLLTKPFVILTGLSGSGKTKLAQAFAMWMSENKEQNALVPVGADWTNREPLLGYPNSLKANHYVKPDTGVLDILLRAHENYMANEKDLAKCTPYFLILDEMNLSHVERYFADFLSTMESGDEIKLYSGSQRFAELDADGNAISGTEIPDKIILPKNLFIIGTVNIDETTYMFSPKVLDRANTIEFRITPEEIEAFYQSNTPLNMDALEAQGKDQAPAFMSLAAGNNLAIDRSKHKDTFVVFFETLQVAGAEFGYRTANEMTTLVSYLVHFGMSESEAYDVAIMQKLLPKLHGSRSKLNKVLPRLIELCQDKYPISLEKLERMKKNAEENGFASYAEA